MSPEKDKFEMPTGQNPIMNGCRAKSRKKAKSLRRKSRKLRRKAKSSRRKSRRKAKSSRRKLRRKAKSSRRKAKRTNAKSKRKQNKKKLLKGGDKDERRDFEDKLRNVKKSVENRLAYLNQNYYEYSDKVKEQLNLYNTKYYKGYNKDDGNGDRYDSLKDRYERVANSNDASRRTGQAEKDLKYQFEVLDNELTFIFSISHIKAIIKKYNIIELIDNLKLQSTYIIQNRFQNKKYKMKKKSFEWDKETLNLEDENIEDMLTNAEYLLYYFDLYFKSIDKLNELRDDEQTLNNLQHLDDKREDITKHIIDEIKNLNEIKVDFDFNKNWNLKIEVLKCYVNNINQQIIEYGIKNQQEFLSYYYDLSDLKNKEFQKNLEDKGFKKDVIDTVINKRTPKVFGFFERAAPRPDYGVDARAFPLEAHARAATARSVAAFKDSDKAEYALFTLKNSEKSDCDSEHLRKLEEVDKGAAHLAARKKRENKALITPQFHELIEDNNRFENTSNYLKNWHPFFGYSEHLNDEIVIEIKGKWNKLMKERKELKEEQDKITNNLNEKVIDGHDPTDLKQREVNVAMNNLKIIRDKLEKKNKELQKLVDELDDRSEERQKEMREFDAQRDAEAAAERRKAEAKAADAAAEANAAEALAGVIDKEAAEANAVEENAASVINENAAKAKREKAKARTSPSPPSDAYNFHSFNEYESWRGRHGGGGGEEAEGGGRGG